MHTIKLLLTYYLNISVQAANLSDCRIESNRKNRFGSENRIETFLPELECSRQQRLPAGWLLSALLAGDIDRYLAGAAPRISCRRSQHAATTPQHGA